MNKWVIVLLLFWISLIGIGTIAVYKTHEAKFKTGVEILVTPSSQQTEITVQKTMKSYLQSVGFMQNLSKLPLEKLRKRLDVKQDEGSLLFTVEVTSSTEKELTELTKSISHHLETENPMKEAGHTLAITTDANHILIKQVNLSLELRLIIWIASMTLLALASIPLYRRVFHP